MGTERNRGKRSSDDVLFAPKWHSIFKEALDDLEFLLTRGYAESSAMQLVGNRYKLNKRQRNAVQRMSASQQEITLRNDKKVAPSDLGGKVVEIDGFNLLILLESILSGAFVFKGRDGLFRDISSVHGSYKRVMKTEDALLIIGNTFKELNIKSVNWYLDQPVSNSGRLKSKMMELSEIHEFNWSVELVFNPDKVLAESQEIIVSSDGWILNHCQHWFNMGAYLISNKELNANVIIA